MQDWSAVGSLGVLGTVLALGIPFLSSNAFASRTTPHSTGHAATVHFVAFSSRNDSRSSAAIGRGNLHIGDSRTSSLLFTGTRAHNGGLKNAVYWSRKGHKGPMHYASASINYGGISCVPYARETSGIELKGNAYTWWDEAAGQYARGNDPEPGSVLNFRSHATMHLGHVAVVSEIISSREIEINHANWWGPGATKSGINRNVSVIDVSPNNDWTAVRVSLGRPGEYGSIYPTYGFIYPRHDDGSGSRMAAHNPRAYDEVAEAPDGKSIEMSVRGWTLDAPDRRLK